MSDELCFPNEKEDLTVKVLNRVTGTNESKLLVKHTYFG